MASREELVREYLRTPKDMGVYRIRNTVNGRAYVGVSRDVRARMNRHRMELKMGAERVAPLLQDWIEHGEAAFVFEVVDLLEPADVAERDPTEDLEALASLWLETLQPFVPDGYNPRPRTAPATASGAGDPGP